MSLISANNLIFSFADKTILDEISFSVEPKDKIGLIGVNGAGKSTLLRIITGEFSLYKGVLSISSDCEIGYMEQHACADSDDDLFNETLKSFDFLFKIEDEIKNIQSSLNEHSPDFTQNLERLHFLNEQYERRGGLTYISRARSALLGLGFSESDFDLPVKKLSGGERSKLSLCKLLLSGSDILILDEPTNHLDIKNINWLENWLIDFKGTLIIVSHDRYFLDRITNKTFEIENGKLYSANADYSGYMRLKEERIKSETKAYNASINEIKRIESIIETQKRFNREKNYITIASKQKSIDRIKKDLKKPDYYTGEIRFSFQSKTSSGNEVLNLTGIEKSFSGKLLFQDVDLELKKGERCFILGDNGYGKSTLLKIIQNKITRDKGRITLGVGVKIGYYDQTLAELSKNISVLDEVWNEYKSMTETEVRSALALFLFKGDDVFKNLSSLSGGEKARVALLKLMLSGANLLVLDEPTNNLDIQSKQVLENALKEYDGTLLIVSHDRYFINSLATKIAFLSINGLRIIEGNYDNYISNSLVENKAENSPKKASPKDNTYRLKKEQESKIRRLKGSIKRLEDLIEELENKTIKYEKQLADPEIISDYQKITELTSLMNENMLLTETKMQEWEILNSQLNEAENGEEKYG